MHYINVSPPYHHRIDSVTNKQHDNIVVLSDGGWLLMCIWSEVISYGKLHKVVVGENTGYEKKSNVTYIHF